MKHLIIHLLPDGVLMDKVEELPIYNITKKEKKVKDTNKKSDE